MTLKRGLAVAVALLMVWGLAADIAIAAGYGDVQAFSATAAIVDRAIDALLRFTECIEDLSCAT